MRSLKRKLSNIIKLICFFLLLILCILLYQFQNVNTGSTLNVRKEIDGNFYDIGTIVANLSDFPELQPVGETLNGALEPKTFWPFNTPPEPRNVTILMWTKYYGNTHISVHIQEEAPIPDWCTVTYDRKELKNSDAIVFHVIGDDFSLLDLPPRNSSQHWVLYILESPANIKISPRKVNGLFNKTMTYRLDSDYPCPYGFATKRQVPLLANPYYADSNFPRQRPKLIAWMVSHCKTSSGRERLVDQLIETNLVKIDIFGQCGTFDCQKKLEAGQKLTQNEIGCYEDLGKIYKFYLSFENSLCKDYVTEKFTNAIFGNMVPIVYGSGDYNAILPPYPKPGFINVRDYESGKELAAYLQYLDQNETAYAEYFEWRRYYKISIKQEFSGFKKICYDLQNPNKMNSVYVDLVQWWDREAKCGTKSMSWRTKDGKSKTIIQ